MRILFVSSSFYPAISYGGPISSTWDLSKELGRRGIEVYVSTTNANKSDKLNNVNTDKHEEIEKNVFVRYYNEQWTNCFSFNFLLNIFSDIKKAEVVYIQYLFHYTVLFSLFSAVLLRKKILLCPRGSLSSFTLSYQKNILKRLWLKLFISPFRRKIIWQASSYLEKEDILRYYPNTNVRIISDGINFESFQDSKIITSEKLIEKYTKRSIGEISEVFFSMGRLHEIKRFDVLIDAFQMYLHNNPNAKLLIAGEDDGIKEDILKQIRNLNLEDSVFLIGILDFNQKKEVLSNSSVFVLTSDFESFGIVIAESLACGTPVIVSDKTPWVDLRSNNCGIFAKNSKEDFCKAFQDIRSQNFLEEDCRKYVKENFDWSVISEKFLKLIMKD